MSRPKIYNINEDYFNTSPDQSQTYLLGLIISDGHLNYDKGRFEYVCKEDDIELINFIKTELNSTHPISNYIINEKLYSRYSICNVKLVRNLIDKFKLPHKNKSQNNIDIPPNIPGEYISHFLRGMFDGDGSIWDGGGTPAAGYTGGETMMKSISEILKSINIHCSFRYRYSNENKNSCQIDIHGSLQVDMLGDYLYKDANMYLIRKRKRFDDCHIIAEKFKTKSFKYNGSRNIILKMYNKGISQSNIAKELKLVPSSVRCCVQRLRKELEII